MAIQIKKKPSGFKGLDLSERNVQDLFSYCYSPNSNNSQGVILFVKGFGYNEDPHPIFFDEKRLEQSAQKIEYLFGQLDVTHKHQFLIAPTDIMLKYDGEKWSEDRSTLSQLLHLGIAAKQTTIFTADDNKARLFTSKPTLSPRDPNFPTWWEEHKAEWEEPQAKV